MLLFFYSTKNALTILQSKISTYKASKKIKFNQTRVESCFSEQDIKELAKLIRQNYSSCLWKKGDILLIDNTKVAHAGMPGSGPRLIRTMICNPIEMNYSFSTSGVLNCRKRTSETVGNYISSGVIPKPTAVMRHTTEDATEALPLT